MANCENNTLASLKHMKSKPNRTLQFKRLYFFENIRMDLIAHVYKSVYNF